jgi:hypothetical protein
MNYEQQLKWLIIMAKSPGWKDYAWNKAKELDADKSRLWTGIAEDLKAAMLAQKSSGAVQKHGG